MARTSDPHKPRSRRLRLLESPDPPQATPPLPVVVPVLSPNQAISPKLDAVLTGLARRARVGDPVARDLLWRVLAPQLEPALIRCGRLAWQSGWARRHGRPWELDDVRQESWLVFSELVEWWNGKGSFIPYATTYFPWRLRSAMRRLGPQRRTIPAHLAAEPVDECRGLLDIEGEALLESITVFLSPIDAEILCLRVREVVEFDDIACRLGISRRTITRRWKHIQYIASEVSASGRPPPNRWPEFETPGWRESAPDADRKGRRETARH